jgi:ketosteroid isomerase-like protein
LTAQRADVDSAHMSQADVEAVRASFDAFAERGLDGLAEFWDPQISWRAMEGAPDDLGEINGVDEMRRYVGEWVEMFDDISFRLLEARDLGGGLVAAKQSLKGTAKLSGATTELTYAALCTIRDGRFVRGREYATVEEALDAARSPG